MNLGPVRDQDTIGNCYAHAAADLLESHLKSKNQIPDDQHISALGLTILHDKDRWNVVAIEHYNLALKTGITSKKMEDDAISENINRLEKEKERLTNKSVEMIKNFMEKEKKNNIPYQKVSQKLEEIKVIRKYDVNHAEDEYHELNKELELLNKEMAGKVFNQDGLYNNLLQIIEIDKKIASYLEIKTSIKNADTPNSGYGFSFSSDRPYFPERGRVTDAIERTWPEICFESEVNSRDEVHIDTASNNMEMLSDFTFTPVFPDLKSRMLYLELNRHSDEYNCNNYLTAKTLFPNFPFQNSSEFFDFLNKFPIEENLFYGILQKSCDDKKITAKPKLKEVMINNIEDIEGIPSKNENILNIIDSELNSGKIVAVNYLSDLLNKITPEDVQSHHASTVTGSLTICDEPYYILRNSWGRESCRSTSLDFQTKTKPETTAALIQINKDHTDCQQKALETFKTKFPDCKNTFFGGTEAGFGIGGIGLGIGENKTDLDTDKTGTGLGNGVAFGFDKPSGQCIEARERITSEADCEKNYYNRKVKELSVPYFCDSNGNFIISKQQLKKGLTGATTINN